EISAVEHDKIETEVRIAEQDAHALEENIMQYGSLSPFTCPECHGVLTALRDGRIERYRCHTGHAYSSGTLLNEGSQQAEARLWDAVRALDEQVMLLNRLGEDQATRGDTMAAERYFSKAADALDRAKRVRDLAMDTDALAPEKVSAS